MYDWNFDFQKAKKDGTRFMIRVVRDGQAVLLFNSLTEARRRFPELDPDKNGPNFTWGQYDGHFDGKPVMRFEDWATERALSI